MTEHIKIIKKETKNFIDIFSPLIAGILVTGISLGILGPYMASKYQIYNDIILENVALSGTNKSGEIFNFWISMFLGIITIIIFMYLKKNDLKNIINEKRNISENFDFLGIEIFLIPIILFLFITQRINFFYLILGIIYFFSYSFIKEKIKRSKIILLLFSIYFFIMSLKAVLDKLINQYEIISLNGIYFITGISFLALLYYLKKTGFKKLDKMILLFQLPFPLVLLTYLSNEYLLDSVEKYRIHYPKRYIISILLITVILTIINIIQYKKKMKEVEEDKKVSLVMISSIIMIFIIHHYVMPIYYHSGDFWHWGEEIVPWHQLINKNMILYEDYSGTSGLYGLVLSFFKNIIFHGTSFSYLPSLVLTNIFWVSLYGILCYLLVGSNFSLIIALLTFLPEYNRINMLILLILLLSNSNLIKNRVQWLQSYVLFSILSVFYYPLNGVAGILGVMPFALVQVYLVYKEKLYIKVLKSRSFWILNILLTYPVILVMKYGIKLIKIILLFSSQSKLADGITAYGQSAPPVWFMQFLSDINLRNKFWYIFIFLIMIFTVLVFLYFFCLYMLKDEKIADKFKGQGFLILTFFIIAIPINYTFTIIRIDSIGLFGRTTATMMTVLIFGLLVFLYKCGEKILGKNIRGISISFCVVLIILLQNRPPTGPDIRNLVVPQKLGEEAKNIKKIYKLNGVVYVDGEKERLPQLGKGFISKEKLEYLKTFEEMKEKLVKTDEYIWPLWDRELISIFDSKVPTKMDSPYLTKSLKSTRENLESMKEKPIIITNLLNYQSYYTYRWIIDNGYVMYRYNNIDFWVRPDRYREVFGNNEEARKNMIELFPSQEIAKIPYSLGNSMKTLNRIFDREQIVDTDKLNIEYSQISEINKNRFKITDNTDPFIVINLSESIIGKDFDFIYIELSADRPYKELRDKKMQIFWSSKEYSMSENRTIRFDYGNGKFLIPAGIHPAWLNTNITKIRLDFDGFEVGTEFEKKQVKFLKLNLNRKE